MGRLSVDLLGINLDNPIIPRAEPLDTDMNSQTFMTLTFWERFPLRVPQKTPDSEIQPLELPNVQTE